MRRNTGPLVHIAHLSLDLTGQDRKGLNLISILDNGALIWERNTGTLGPLPVESLKRSLPKKGILYERNTGIPLLIWIF